MFTLVHNIIQQFFYLLAIIRRNAKYKISFLPQVLPWLWGKLRLKDCAIKTTNYTVASVRSRGIW